MVREDRARKYREVLTMTATPIVSSNRPTGAEAIAAVQSLRREYLNDAGQVVRSDVYHAMPNGAYSAELPYAVEVLADRPRGYWRLGERSGTTATDASGNGRHGTYSGTYTAGQAGGLSGDGDAAAAAAAAFTAGRVTLPANTVWGALDGGAVTIEAWFKTTGGGTLRLYLDGASVGSRSGTVTPLAMYSNWIGTGRWGLWPGAGAANPADFGGTIDEVAVYGSALPADRVAAPYEAGNGSPRGVHRTEVSYNDQGRVRRVKNPNGTVTRVQYDGLGREVGTWVGTDDTPASGFWSPANTAGTDLVPVGESQYDGGGVGDGNLTKVTQHPTGATSATYDRVTQTWYDWRNRPVAPKSGVQTGENTSDTVNRQLTYLEYDNLGRVTVTYQYDGDGLTPTDGNSDGVPDQSSSSYLRAKTATSYDGQGRAFRTTVYSVNQSTGTVGSGLATNTWFDKRGNVIKRSQPGGLVYKHQFDGAGARPSGSSPMAAATRPGPTRTT